MRMRQSISCRKFRNPENKIFICHINNNTLNSSVFAPSLKTYRSASFKENDEVQQIGMKCRIELSRSKQNLI